MLLHYLANQLFVWAVGHRIDHKPHSNLHSCYTHVLMLVGKLWDEPSSILNMLVIFSQSRDNMAANSFPGQTSQRQTNVHQISSNVLWLSEIFLCCLQLFALCGFIVISWKKTWCHLISFTVHQNSALDVSVLEGVSHILCLLELFTLHLLPCKNIS